MAKVKIPNGAWVLVADGAKALVLANHGDATLPDLRVVNVFETQEGERTSELGTDAPGRTFSGNAPRRAAYEQTDWHQIGEHRFAKTIADMLNREVLKPSVPALIIVAPASALADLRHGVSKQVRDKILGELDKDLTKHPIPDIEKIVADTW